MKIVSFMAAATVAVMMTLVGCGDGPGKTPETTAANPLAGTWEAVLPPNPTTGLTTTITLNIIDTETVDTFTLTVDTPMSPVPPMMQEFSGMVEVTDTMITATITGISNDGEAVPAAAVPGVLAQLQLSATQELTYMVSETDPPTVTVMGELLTALGLQGGTLMAEKTG
jgi:hypothetical protein